MGETRSSLIRFRNRAGIVAVLVLLAACGSAENARSLPADAELQRQFTGHEAQFRELQRMSDEDSWVWRIAPGFLSVQQGGGPPRSGDEKDLPRWDRYRELFRQCGLKDGLLRDRTMGREAIFFPVAARTVGTVDSIEKGIAWVEGEVSPIVPSLDEGITWGGTRRAAPVFHRLKDNWYLYLRYNE